VGPIFKTKTKDRSSIGTEYLGFVVKNIDIPYTIIGDIKEHDIVQIIKSE